MKYVSGGCCLQNGRQTNMDRLLIKERKIGGEDALLCVVCDGVGSLRDGAFAAEFAAAEMDAWFGAVTDLGRIGLLMRDAASEINARVVTETERLGITSAATFTALLLVGGRYCIAHVGDSRVYCLYDGALSTLTHDDVSETGKLSAYIGSPVPPVFQYLEGDLADRTFIVCSDGLYKRMDLWHLAASVSGGLKSARAAKKTVRALTKYVIDRGESDNISAAVIRCIP